MIQLIAEQKSGPYTFQLDHENQDRKRFLQIMDKCFPPLNKLNKIFNRKTIIISNSCMSNMKKYHWWFKPARTESYT